MISKKLCVVIPYRDRETHLKSLLPTLEKVLNHDKIQHSILVIEQVQGKSFNRGMMKNIGAKWAIENNYDYVCFHDVDMVPIPGFADYRFENAPVHLAVEVEQFGFKIPYESFFGGVLMIPTNALIKNNGYRNDYWGWGAEDDCFLSRCVSSGLQPMRRNCRFNSFDHPRDIDPVLYNKNLEIYRNESPGSDPMQNGISTLEYETVKISDELYSKVPYKKITVKI